MGAALIVLHVAGTFKHNILEIHIGCQNTRILCSILVCDPITEFFKDTAVLYENWDHDEVRG